MLLSYRLSHNACCWKHLVMMINWANILLLFWMLNIQFFEKPEGSFTFCKNNLLNTKSFCLYYKWNVLCLNLFLDLLHSKLFCIFSFINKMYCVFQYKSNVLDFILTDLLTNNNRRQKHTHLNIRKLSQVRVHSDQRFVRDVLVVVQPKSVCVLKHTHNTFHIIIKWIKSRF